MIVYMYNKINLVLARLIKYNESFVDQLTKLERRCGARWNV